MTTMTSDRGTKIYNWIIDQLDDGYTVYATTYLRSIKITSKHRDMVKVDGAHCVVQRGRQWESINFCEISARK